MVVSRLLKHSCRLRREAGRSIRNCKTPNLGEEDGAHKQNEYCARVIMQGAFCAENDPGKVSLKKKKCNNVVGDTGALKSPVNKAV